MSDSSETQSCLNCGTPEDRAPLLRLRYAGVEAWLCSQCMPVLIHNPEEVGVKLKQIAGVRE